MKDLKKVMDMLNSDTGNDMVDLGIKVGAEMMEDTGNQFLARILIKKGISERNRKYLKQIVSYDIEHQMGKGGNYRTLK